MSVLFTDSGTGADANPAGGSFVTITGWTGVRRVSNQFANAAGSDGDCGARINVATTNDHYTQITTATVGARDGGPMVRVQVATASGVLLTDYNGTDVEVYVVVAGGFGSFVDRDTGTYTAGGTVYFEVQGTTYISKINGATINSFTDATFAVGQGGVFMYDNTQRFTNIEVGNFVAGGAFTLAMGQGSLALSGQTCALRAARRLTMGQGSLTITGQSAGLKAARKIAAAQGSLTLNGQTVTLTGPATGFTLAMGQGSLVITGSDAQADFAITCISGSYTITGQAAGLKAGRRISAGQGSLSLTGQACALRKDSRLPCANGSLALNGQTANLSIAGNKRLTAASGSYALTGNNATLIGSGGGSGYVIDRPFDPFGWWS